MRTLFTSESVTEGHPDKVCDQISDAVLDALLARDPMARVACETCATTGLVQVMGEITTTAYVAIDEIARQVLRDIGYVDASLGFSADSCAVLTAVHAQSPDIAMGVDHALETREAGESSTGAGDQGMMFGFACDETPERMPLPISLAHSLSRRLAQVRKEGVLPWLRPDGKCQVTVVYEDGAPVAVDTVVLSAQHDESVERTQLEKSLLDAVIREAVPARLWTPRTKVYINPTGRFVLRPGGGYGPDRPQDHRGYLWRLRTARRRRVQRQGPLQGRPLRLLCRPVRRQAHGGRGAGPARRGGAGLRHRRSQTRQRTGEHLRHRCTHR